MDRTTYADPGVVSLIDAAFVAVRVDADRHPDVNERYNLGGWPTTAFLTGSGELLSGGTYMSADQMTEMLHHVSAAYRDRAVEIARAVAERREVRDVRRVRLQPDPDPVLSDHSTTDYFRALLIDRFDPMYGGFGSAPKFAHPNALLFALSLTEDDRDPHLLHIIETTLDGLRALWDPTGGGFFRYADGADWSRPATEKTIEDNAALLHVYVDAGVRGIAGAGERAAEIVQFVRTRLADRAHGGFYNAQTPLGSDVAVYIDRTAMMVGAFIRAAALFDDIWLRDFALKSVDAVIVPSYTPGDGVGHTGLEGSESPVRGLLTDQIHVAAALIWAHAATGQLPYSMLAAELIQFAIRKMWDDRTGAFRDRMTVDDPMMPFELNCYAACVLSRLAMLTGETGYHDRARRILDSLSSEFRQLDLFGAAYAVAVREVIDGHPPAGLQLSRVDWQLG